MNGSFTWKILDDRDVHRLQMFLRPDSREQQQLRRIYGTTGGDYLLCGAGNSKFTTLKMRSLKLTSPNSASCFGARTWFRALSAGNRFGKKQSFPMRESKISLYCWLCLFLFTFCKIQYLDEDAKSNSVASDSLTFITRPRRFKRARNTRESGIVNQFDLHTRNL